MYKELCYERKSKGTIEFYKIKKITLTKMLINGIFEGKLSMLTYTGTFDKDAMIAAAKRYAPLHLNKNNKDESEVPFQELSTGVIGYVQFALLAGNWCYVNVRW